MSVKTPLNLRCTQRSPLWALLWAAVILLCAVVSVAKGWSEGSALAVLAGASFVAMRSLRGGSASCALEVAR